MSHRAITAECPEPGQDPQVPYLSFQEVFEGPANPPVSFTSFRMSLMPTPGSGFRYVWPGNLFGSWIIWNFSTGKKWGYPLIWGDSRIRGHRRHSGVFLSLEPRVASGLTMAPNESGVEQRAVRAVPFSLPALQHTSSTLPGWSLSLQRTYLTQLQRALYFTIVSCLMDAGMLCGPALILSCAGPTSCFSHSTYVTRCMLGNTEREPIQWGMQWGWPKENLVGNVLF